MGGDGEQKEALSLSFDVAGLFDGKVDTFLPYDLFDEVEAFAKPQNDVKQCGITHSPVKEKSDEEKLLNRRKRNKEHAHKSRQRKKHKFEELQKTKELLMEEIKKLVGSDRAAEIFDVVDKEAKQGSLYKE